jgi:Zn-dependent alcohol dehydrogenase
MIRMAIELLESETLVPDALVTHRMGLAAVSEALALMAAGQALKISIDPAV